MSEKIEVVTATKHDAQSRSIQYLDRVDLKNNSKTQVTAIPSFINHDSRDTQGVVVKIETYGKAGIERMVPQKSISLGEEETNRLFDLLKRAYQLAEHADSGDYITIKAVDGTADLGSIDPEQVAESLIKVLSQSDIVSHLKDVEFSAEIVSALQTKIRFSEMEQALDALEMLLNSGVKEEKYYQEWCQDHSWAFGNAYIVNDDTRSISAGDSVDLLLPRVFGGMRDLVELKRPDMVVLRRDESHKNYYFSSDVSKAIGQCHRYLDVFSEDARKGLRDRPEIFAYHPCATLVIGRSNEWEKEEYEALHGLNSRLSSMTIMTYDLLLQQGRQILEAFIVPENGSKTSALVYDEDIPF